MFSGNGVKVLVTAGLEAEVWTHTCKEQATERGAWGAPWTCRHAQGNRLPRPFLALLFGDCDFLDVQQILFVFLRESAGYA